MNKPVRIALAILSLAPLPVSSQELAEEPAEPRAIIITDVTQPVSCISAVHINTIDGKNVQVSHSRFEIGAGEHTMTGRARLDLRYCPVGQGGRSHGGRERIEYPPLEGFFEAGQKYYVGFDHSSENRENWGLAVWKIEVVGDQ